MTNVMLYSIISSRSQTPRSQLYAGHNYTNDFEREHSISCPKNEEFLGSGTTGKPSKLMLSGCGGFHLPLGQVSTTAFVRAREVKSTQDTGGRFKHKILRTIAKQNDKDGHGMNQTCSTHIVQTLFDKFNDQRKLRSIKN